MKTKEVIENELMTRIANVKEYLNSAQFCLNEYTYFQCAVRLEEIANIVRFDNILMRVFESESKDCQ